MVDRRGLLAAGAGLALFGPIERALAIDADRRHGSLMDIEHVVILMQENRGFDHYFGTLHGVRGFGDRFPIPVASAEPRRTVWTQLDDAARGVMPFHLDTLENYALMCALGTPHTWPDAQAAWDEGRMRSWPAAKTVRAMGHYGQGDIPFQVALAEAFTLCDAYHCAIQTGTNSNRLFLWTGTNDPEGRHGGPAIGNSHDSLVKNGGYPEGYRWTTYVERLHDAGIDWRIYQDMADNFSDNPLAGFQRFRDAYALGPGGPDHDLIARGLSTHGLDRLRADVLSGKLPQVSYVVSDAASSEHPAASSPAQGADYTARVLDALTTNPAVWARTVLLVMFDENDGYFDHAPPPAPPSRDPQAADGWAGASSVATDGEYHRVASAGDAKDERPALIGRPYGLGPRVPLYVISPWSRGGWVNSQVFDHTSVIRLIEARFGVREPNISPWRRAVCGDLTSAFDFERPNRRAVMLPATGAGAQRARAVPDRPPAAPPPDPAAPEQARGTRRARPLPYALAISASMQPDRIDLHFANTGQAGAVLHVYDRLHLDRVPRRYTVAAGATLEGAWHTADDGGRYDLWVLGPNGFHRHFAGAASAGEPSAMLRVDRMRNAVVMDLHNPGPAARHVSAQPMAYAEAHPSQTLVLPAGSSTAIQWPLARTAGWYDIILRSEDAPQWLRRFAGHVEDGRASIADPAMGGTALLRHSV
jgi:phospholipase C